MKRKVVAQGEEYVPHFFNELIDVPAMSEFGSGHIVRYTTSTHDKAAYLTTDPAVIQEMINHYSAKIDEAADDMALIKEDIDEGAETLVVSYGIISRSAAVAVREARSRGIKVSSLVLQTLWPVSKTAITAAMKGVKKVIVPEMNTGQYILEIERLAPTGVEVIGVNKMNTKLVSPKEISQKVCPQ